MHHLSYIQLDQHAFAHNINQLSSLLNADTIIAPVIKANAYGHGIDQIAHMCQQHQKIQWLCVVSLTEALYVRSIGITKNILVLNIIDAELKHAFDQHIILAVGTVELAQKLNALGAQIHKKISVHLKIDTGLSRAGMHYVHAPEYARSVYSLPHINIEGAFTHLADPEDYNFSMLQMRRFQAFLHRSQKNNIYFKYIHLANSATLFLYPACHHNFVRPGIMLYGVWPSKKIKEYHHNITLKPILNWKTRIIELKTIPVDSTIGYNRTYCASKKMTIALLPVGYADGYNRCFSNHTAVKIDNQYAPVVGAISMNLTTIDVSNISSVYVGQEITLIGQNEPISIEYLAEQNKLFVYELLTHINQKIPRIIV